MGGCAVISQGSGDLLRTDVDALVNTVNTVGVMGKGLALQFKRAYPDMFRDYARAAKAGELALGRVQVWETGRLDGPRYVINFPTKGHWRSRSRLADVEAGLADLVRVVRELDVRSIAVPPLGCGNGGLAWSEVEPRIREAFAALPDVEVVLFAPAAPPAASTMTVSSPTPRMTPGRAALVELLVCYGDVALECSQVEVQKLMYFLQRTGEPLRLRYAPGRYGPYADNLRSVLRDMEGHYLSGFGDGSARVMDAEPIVVLPGASEAAGEVMAGQVATRARIERVMTLVDGFESMYGLELLATVDWVISDGASADDIDAVVAAVHRWSPRKGRMFSPRHIGTAVKALREHGWLTSSAEADPLRRE